MTNAQIWTALGILAAALVATVTTVSTLFVHVVKAEVGGLRAELRSEIRRLDDKLDSLNRDLQLLFHRVFGPDSG